MSRNIHPFTLAWTARLQMRLEKRGSKSELARYLSSLYGHQPRSWQCRLQEILANRTVPSAEIYMAIEDYLSKP